MGEPWYPHIYALLAAGSRDQIFPVQLVDGIPPGSPKSRKWEEVQAKLEEMWDPSVEEIPCDSWGDTSCFFLEHERILGTAIAQVVPSCFQIGKWLEQT